MEFDVISVHNAQGQEHKFEACVLATRDNELTLRSEKTIFPAISNEGKNG